MTNNMPTTIENVLLKGDLADLSTEQRLTYYKSVCESTGLNPLTQPFEYIRLNGKLVLYAKKAATDQLRSVHGISINSVNVDYVESMIVVTASASNNKGRSDTDVGVVDLAGLSGERKSNALMKAITKAKRRVTLSICGLGMLDETEVETIPDAQPAPEATKAISFEKPKHYFNFEGVTDEGFEMIYDHVIQKNDCIHKGGALYEFDKKVSLKTKDGTDKLEQFYIGQELPATNGHVEVEQELAG